MRYRTTALLTLLTLLVASSSALRAAKEAPATQPSKPTVVCFGDSITASGYPAALGKHLGAEVVNAGVGGQSTRAAMGRFKKDVLDRKPAVVVLLFGTNDSRLAEPGVHVPVPEYERNLTAMIEQSRAGGAKVVVCTIPPIDADAYFTRHKKEPFDKAGGFEKVLSEYRVAATRAAEAKRATVVDLATLLAEEPGWLSNDGVHPTEKGKAAIARLVGDAVGPMLGQASSTTKPTP